MRDDDDRRRRRATKRSSSASPPKSRSFVGSSRSRTSASDSKIPRERLAPPRRRSGRGARAAARGSGPSGRPAGARSAESGSSSPARTRSSVVFPAPFGPTTPMRARRHDERHAVEDDVAAPWLFVMSVAERVPAWRNLGYSSPAHGGPQEENLEGAPRQAPRDAPDRGAAREPLPAVRQPEQPHRMCPTCKTYNGREVEPLRIHAP